MTMATVQASVNTTSFSGVPVILSNCLSYSDLTMTRLHDSLPNRPFQANLMSLEHIYLSQ
jgi:hypothetical protein